MNSMVIFADTSQGLRLLMNKVAEVSGKYDLEVNINITKTMIISKEEFDQVSFTIDGRVVEKVTTCIYLGFVLNEQWDHSEEIKAQIEKARAAFNFFC